MRHLFPLLVLGFSLMGCAGNAEAASPLDAKEDTRLNTPVSVTAHHTTVGAVLAALAKETGVELRAASPIVREEPVIAFLRKRPLHSVLTLLAEQFRWGPNHEYGWAWRRRGTGETTRYELEDDLKTRLAGESFRSRDRQLFAEDLAAMDPPKTPLPKPPYSPDDEHLLAALPPLLVEAALAGKPAGMRWREFPEPLREVARVYMAPNGGAGNDAWVEVQTKGAGSTLTLFVNFLHGSGGIGKLIQPQKYRERFRPPTPQPGAPEYANLKPVVYTGLAARPVQLMDKERRLWSEARTLPDLLELLVNATGVEFLADDFDYGVYWGPRSLASPPAGEPLGVWLDRFPDSVHLPGSRSGSQLKWREKENCVLLRSADWYAQEAERPPTALLQRVRALQREDTPHLLTLEELRTLVDGVDDPELGRLEHAGYLGRGQLQGIQTFFRLWAALPPGLQKQLLTKQGVRMGQLPPNLRRALTTTGPFLEPVINDWILVHQMGGDVTFAYWLEKDRLYQEMRPAMGQGGSHSWDLRLPEQDPEMVRVTREPAPPRSK